jgi:glutathione S-transferase
VQAFKPSEGAAYERKAETVLFELESMLADGRRYICGATLTYADIVLASLLAPWALSLASRKLFGGRTNCSAFSEADLPQGFLDWQARTQLAYPQLFDLILRLYSQHRQLPPQRS